MDTAPLPSGLKTARLVAYVQGALGLVIGIVYILGGSAFATAAGLSGVAGTLAIVAAGVVITTAAGLLVWATMQLAGCAPRA
ncbi:MAG: hypothetical protein ACYDC2_13410, partial [Solirubrobacteraceae bacterium]